MQKAGPMNTTSQFLWNLTVSAALFGLVALFLSPPSLDISTERDDFAEELLTQEKLFELAEKEKAQEALRDSI